MSDTRARFEEIWPVPEGVYWREQVSEYWTDNHSMGCLMDEWNDRLDTFTRCQETTDVYVSLVEELVRELEQCRPSKLKTLHDYGCMDEHDRQSALIVRANKVIGREQ